MNNESVNLDFNLNVVRETENKNEGPLLNSDANNVQSKSSNSIDLNIVPMSGDGANSQQPISGEGNQSQLPDLNDLPSVEMDFDMSVDKEEDGMADDTEDAAYTG